MGVFGGDDSVENTKYLAETIEIIVTRPISIRVLIKGM